MDGRRRDPILTDTDKLMEALGILQEECAEVIKEVSKCRRSGLDFKPFNGDKTNLQRLRSEIQDVLSILKIIGEDELDDVHYLHKVAALCKWSSLFDDK